MQQELRLVMDSYVNLGVSVIPLNGMRSPLVNDWQKYGNEYAEKIIEPEFNAEEFKGIGLVLGKACPYMCIDIDATDPEIVKALKSLVPYTPIQRFSSKGIMLFYAKNEQIVSRKFQAIDLEIFASSGYVAVPPSWNAKANGGLGGPAYWVDKSILDIKIEHLPTFSLEHVKALEYFNEQQKQHNVGDKKEGRHNRLFAQVMAALYKREDLDIIAQQITQYDLKWHVPSYFKDPDHKYKCTTDEDCLKAAKKWIKGIVKTWESTNGSYQNGSSNNDEIQDQVIKAKKFEVRSYPEPQGVLKDITDYILSESYTYVPNMALGSAIAIFATVLGNKLEFDDVRGNCFILLLADSGSGKKFGINAARKILLEHKRIGSGDYMSSQAIASSLYDNVVRLDLNDEFSKLLKIAKGNVWQSAVPQELARLWSASNDSFDLPTYAYAVDEKKENKQKETTIHHPYISMLAATTPSELKQNLDKNSFTSGFFPRFLVFIDKKPDSALTRIDKEKSSELLKIVKSRIDLFIKPGMVDLNPSSNEDLISLALDKEAFNEYENQMQKFFKDASKIEDESMRAIYNRSREYYKKLALIHCYSRSGEEINSVDLNWAREVVETSFYNCQQFLAEASAENKIHSYKERVLNLICEFPGIYKEKLTYKTQWLADSRLRNSILQELEDSGRIISKLNKTKGRDKVSYFAVEYDQ